VPTAGITLLVDHTDLLCLDGGELQQGFGTAEIAAENFHAAI